MSVRIAGGVFAGRELLGPPRSARGWTTGLRPTAIRLRKSVFEVVGGDLREARVLDVCAGVGALGFEALSRGAASCAFIERSRVGSALIVRNAGRLGVDRERFRLRTGDAARILPRLLAAGEGFDVILLDPPWSGWRDGLAGTLVRRTGELEPALLAVEHPASLTPEGPPGYRAARSLTAGDGAFTLFHPEAGKAHMGMTRSGARFVAHRPIRGPKCGKPPISIPPSLCYRPAAAGGALR